MSETALLLARLQFAMWFAALWAAGVATVAAVAFVLKLAIGA